MYYAQHADGQPTYQAPPVYLAPPVSRAPSLYGSHPQFYSQGSMPSQVIYSSGPSAATAPMNSMMRRTKPKRITALCTRGQCQPI